MVDVTDLEKDIAKSSMIIFINVIAKSSRILFINVCMVCCGFRTVSLEKKATNHAPDWMKRIEWIRWRAR